MESSSTVTRTTAIVLSLLSTLFAYAASAGEVAYTCNYQLGSEAEATRRKIGSVIVAINVDARTARVDFGKGWFKTMSLSVDGTDVKETSPPASGAELGFFYFDLAANSGGFSGGGGNHEFFDSCVPTKITDLVDKSTHATVVPHRSEPIQGQTAAPSEQGATPEAEPKLATKPEPNEAASPPPSSIPSEPAATAEANAEEKDGKDLAASTPAPRPAPSPIPEPEKNTAEPLSAAPPPSLAAAPPPSTQPTTGDERDATTAAKASEPPEQRPAVEPQKNAIEPSPATPPPNLPASPPADAQAAADYPDNVSDAAKTPTAQPEPSAAVEPDKNATKLPPASPSPSEATATADTVQPPAATPSSTGVEEKPSPPSSLPPSAATEPAVTTQAPAVNSGTTGAEEKPSPPAVPPPVAPPESAATIQPPTANPGSAGTEEKPSPSAAPSPPAEPAVAAAPTVEPCLETLDAEAHAATITFANSSAIISNESVAELRKIAETARGCANVAIEVGGHTDNFGSRLVNRELSQRRADAVVGVLIREGVAAEKLRAVGYGQDQPIASNATAAGRRMNRRVEFHITPAKTSG